MSTAATSANIEATDGSLGVDEQTTMTIARNHPPSKARYIVVAAGIWSNSVEAESLVKMGIRLASALPSVWFIDERKSERFLAETLFLSENAPGANTILLLCLAGSGMDRRIRIYSGDGRFGRRLTRRTGLFSDCWMCETS